MTGDRKQTKGTFWDAGHILFLSRGPGLLWVILLNCTWDSCQLYIGFISAIHLVCALQIKVEPQCSFGLLTGVHSVVRLGIEVTLVQNPESQCLKMEHRCVCSFCHI